MLKNHGPNPMMNNGQGTALYAAAAGRTADAFSVGGYLVSSGR
jgi:hypothetical protein